MGYCAGNGALEASGAIDRCLVEGQRQCAINLRLLACFYFLYPIPCLHKLSCQHVPRPSVPRLSRVLAVSRGVLPQLEEPAPPPAEGLLLCIVGVGATTAGSRHAMLSHS